MKENFKCIVIHVLRHSLSLFWGHWRLMLIRTDYNLFLNIQIYFIRVIVTN